MTDAIETIYNITNFILSLSAGVAVGMIIFAGLSYITSLGNEERMTKAKSTALFVFIGLAIILFAKVIVYQLAVQVSGVTLSDPIKNKIFGGAGLPTSTQPGSGTPTQTPGNPTSGKQPFGSNETGNANPNPAKDNTPSDSGNNSGNSAQTGYQDPDCVIAPEAPECGFSGEPVDVADATQPLAPLEITASATGVWYDDNKNRMVVDYKLNRPVSSGDEGAKLMFNYKIKRSNGILEESKYGQKILPPDTESGKLYISSHFSKRGGSYSCTYNLVLVSGGKTISSLFNRTCYLEPPSYFSRN